jgi:yecA family protein
MKSEPLEDSEFETLSGILHRFGGKNAMNVEQIDGFLTALTCNPIHISAHQYLPLIWGDEMITENAFTHPILQDFLSLVARHKSGIVRTLRSGDVFTPLLLADEMASTRATIGQTGLCVE